MMIITAVFDWVLGTAVGRIAAAALMGLVAWQWNNSVQRDKGAAAVVAKIERAADANAKKADSVRRDVDRLPAERLRDGYFRD
jgi:hypothetical protein